jgi:hypothetical protein
VLPVVLSIWCAVVPAREEHRSDECSPPRFWDVDGTDSVKVAVRAGESYALFRREDVRADHVPSALAGVVCSWTQQIVSVSQMITRF